MQYGLLIYGAEGRWEQFSEEEQQAMTEDYMAIPPVWFPSHPALAHFTGALLTYRGLQGLWNSLIISSATTVLSTLFGTMMTVQDLCNFVESKVAAAA